MSQFRLFSSSTSISTNYLELLSEQKKRDFLDELDLENLLLSFLETDQSSIFSSSSFSSQQKEEKKVTEKRKRYQTYLLLDYFLSTISYFDFFSKDSFTIAKSAKNLAQLFEKKEVTPDLLLFPFLDTESPSRKFLMEIGITSEMLYSFMKKEHEKKKEKKFFLETEEIKKEKSHLPIYFSVLKKIEQQTQEIFDWFVIPEGKKTFMKKEKNKKSFFLNQRIPYSFEVHQLFEKCSENALERFKTPIISSEILLLTLLEEKQFSSGKFLRRFFQTDTEWYLFRYKLLKELHEQESSIRTEVSPNQQFFAYLLRSRLSENEFLKSMQKKELASTVSFFRNHLIIFLLQQEFQKKIKKEIYTSIHITSSRVYSS
jgi:hypothetical protein